MQGEVLEQEAEPEPSGAALRADLLQILTQQRPMLDQIIEIHSDPLIGSVGLGLPPFGNQIIDVLAQRDDEQAHCVA
jgi:hypothetical protein